MLMMMMMMMIIMLLMMMMMMMMMMILKQTMGDLPNIFLNRVVLKSCQKASNMEITQLQKIVTNPCNKWRDLY